MNLSKYRLLRAYFVGSITAALLTVAYKVGHRHGEAKVTERVNAVLRAQMKLPHLGGTWDAIAEELNGEP